jgi:hypothetical protein
MVLVDYIGIFLTCGNTFGHILYKIFMKNVKFTSFTMEVEDYEIDILSPIRGTYENKVGSGFE